MKLLYRPLTAAQITYYSLRSIAPKNIRLLPECKNRYESDFIQPSTFIRDFLPFNYLKPGAKVVHVGFDRTYMDKGMSHPLLEAAISGANGTVRAFDPDMRNIDAINEYSISHGITQLEGVHGAAWNDRKELEFEFDSDWGPMSGTTEIAAQADYSNKKGNNISKKITSDRLDEMILPFFPDRRIDFLALTANGAEPEIIQGAEKILKSNPELVISLALAHKHFSFDIRLELCNEMMQDGWNVVVSNSLHDPWMSKPFLWCCLYRGDPEQHGADNELQSVTWDQAQDLATLESQNLERVGNEIREHVLRAPIEASRESAVGLFKRKARKLKGKLISKLKSL